MAEQTKFEILLDNIRIQLLEAQISFDIFLALSGPEDDAVSGTVGSYIGFFEPTRAALRDRILIKVANVTETKRKKAPSVYSLIKMLETDPLLAPLLDTADLRTRMENLKIVAGKVRRLRDKTAAHLELGANPEDVYIHEIRDMLVGLETVFNATYKALHPGETWSFTPVQSSDTKNLLDSLHRYHKCNAPARLVAWTAVQDPNNPEQYIIAADRLERLRQSVQ